MHHYLPNEKRLELFKRAAKGESVSDICRKEGISRTIYYRWLKQGKSTLKSKHPKSLSTTKVNAILKIALQNPDYTLDKIAKIVNVSKHGVWNVLKRKGLNTSEKRHTYISINGKGLVSAKNTDFKLRIIKRYETGESISDLCKTFNISRTVFYRWLKRYQASNGQITALNSMRPAGDRHYRSMPEARELIIQLVIEHPEYSAHKLAQALTGLTGSKLLGVHGVHNLLTRLNLSHLEDRLEYARLHSASVSVPQSALEFELPQAPKYSFISYLPPPVARFISSYGILSVASFFGFLIFIVFIQSILNAGGIFDAIGIILAWMSLILGMFFFVYSVKYYITIAIVLSFSRNQLDENENNGDNKLHSFWGRLFGIEVSIDSGNKKKIPAFINKKINGLQHDLYDLKLERYPFVSVQLSTYNEKRVINRLLTAATSMDYPNYEVILADDSNDETVELIKAWEKHPRVKISRRESRDGYKGGALREALKITDPKAEFILILDADFIPYPDTITSFLKYFQYTAGTLDFNKEQIAKNKEQLPSASGSKPSASNIAAVQGYQWHVLNKSENWITRGVRSEYAGSYVIERSGAEVYGGLKQISGSVYMIRRDVLSSVGWGTSITEDFELTLRLYEKGWKVVYTPYIQTPAEAVSTLKRLIRQRMRWAEGHSFNTKRMFKRLMFGSFVSGDGQFVSDTNIVKWINGFMVENNKHKKQFNNLTIQQFNHIDKSSFKQSPLTLPEKLEFLYLVPYYLQAAFFILGTISWLIAETVFRVRLPFWTEIWGWSLVLTNLFALPLMNLVGLFMEESDEKDYTGLFSFVALSYIVAPFQAYAAIKGFMEDKEGPWFRTPKTGRITDIFVPGRFTRIFSGLFGREGDRQVPVLSTESVLALLKNAPASNSSLFGLARMKKRKVGNLFLVSIAAISLIVSSLAPYVAVWDVASASSFSTAKRRTNSSTKYDNTKIINMNKPLLKKVKTEKGSLDYIFDTQPQVKARSDSYELDLELTGINGQMLLSKSKVYRKGDLFIYENIKKDIDAQMRYSDGGYSSELKLKKYIQIKSIEYRIKTNLEAKLLDNEVVFYNSKDKDKNIFVVKKPFMYEELNPQNVNSSISYKIVKTFDGWKLTKVLSENASRWLSDSDRSFPVIIDPTVNSVIQTAITNTIDSRWESPARKVAYMPNASGGAAWYATHTDDGAVFLEKCKVSDGCESTSDWSVVSTQLDTAESDADNRNSTVWKHGDVLYIAWFDNNTDKYQFTTINTASSDSQGSVCSGADKGSATDVYLSIAVAADGDVYISMAERGTGDGTADLEGQSRIASGGCTETDIQTGSSIDQNDSIEVLTIGNNAFYIFNDNTGLRLSVYVDDGTPGWDTSNMDLNGGTADNDNSDLSAVTDGTDIWVFQRNGTTGNSDLYKCSSCPTTSQTFTALTDPWSAGDFSAAGNVGLSYLSSANEIMAVMVDDQAGTNNHHILSKKTNADSISWQSEFEFDIGSQNIAIDHLTMTAVVPTSDQAAVVYQDRTNSEFEFSTVPENIYILIIFLPLFMWVKKCLNKSHGEFSSNQAC